MRFLTKLLWKTGLILVAIILGPWTVFVVHTQPTFWIVITKETLGRIAGKSAPYSTDITFYLSEFLQFLLSLELIIWGYNLSGS